MMKKISLPPPANSQFSPVPQFFLGVHSRDDLYIYNCVWGVLCVCDLAHRSQQSKFMWFLSEGVQFLLGLVFVFLSKTGGKVMLRFSEIREGESGLSQGQAIRNFLNHLALVGL